MEKVRLEKQGRIVLPKKVRDRLGLREGEQLQIAERDGAIILTPALSPQEFAAGFRGCVTRAALDPLSVKRIWKA